MWDSLFDEIIYSLEINPYRSLQIHTLHHGQWSHGKRKVNPYLPAAVSYFDTELASPQYNKIKQRMACIWVYKILPNLTKAPAIRLPIRLNEKRALFQYAINANLKIEVASQYQVRRSCFRKELFIKLGIYTHMWKALFQNPTYELGIGILSPFFGVTLIAFWKRALHWASPVLDDRGF